MENPKLCKPSQLETIQNQYNQIVSIQNTKKKIIQSDGYSLKYDEKNMWRPEKVPAFCEGLSFITSEVSDDRNSL